MSNIYRPLCKQPDRVHCFKHGGHCKLCGFFDEAPFSANWHPVLFVYQSLFIKFTQRLYQSFGRDMVLGLIMCEIWQFNLERYFDRNSQENASTVLSDPANRRKLLSPCNAYSISQTLGIPNETVRRKIKKLVEKGWVENGNGELFATKEFEDFFGVDFRADIMREFVSAARHILAMLNVEPDPNQSK